MKHRRPRIITSAVIMFIFLSAPLYSEERFAPAAIEVTAGDENTFIKQAVPGRAASKRHDSVNNGPQGGAYLLIRFFQTLISPQDGPSCKYIPTCSAYGREAVVKHGALTGSVLAAERVLRCNPYTERHGHDPVPEKPFSGR